ncbi:hypothetical protein P3W45_000025 [Vairimorpha bombi]|jgi:hypothetical protein
MKIKSNESVHFLDSLSLDEELHLINQQPEIKPKVTKNKAFGKSLQLDENALLNKNNFEFVDFLYKYENENAFFTTMMLLSASPFTNFLDNCKEKIPDLQNYPVLEKMITMLDIIRSSKTVDIEKYIPYEECTDLKDGYSFLLRNIHQELCTYMHFEENAWSSQKKGKAFRNIYPEYSPIVEIFQGKIQDDVGSMKAGYFEIVKDIDFSSLVNSSNCKKIPSVILVQNGKISKADGFIPTSVFTSNGKSLSLVLIGTDKGYEYTSTGFKILDSTDDIKNIKYIIYSRNK